MNCEPHGFDLSTEQFPAAKFLLEIVFRHLQNALESLSAKFLGYFDVIQVRLITLGLRGGDWNKAVENREAVCGGFDPDHASCQ